MALSSRVLANADALERRAEAAEARIKELEGAMRDVLTFCLTGSAMRSSVYVKRAWELIPIAPRGSENTDA